MDLTRKSQVAALVARVGLGVWFAYSGGYKIFASGLDRFTKDVANYQLVGAPLDAVVAYTLPWVELVAGFCLILGYWRRGAILTLAGLVLVFSVAIGWAWSRGLDIACGCMGRDEPINYWGKVGEFTLYGVILGWLWWMESRRQGSKTG
jgi:uncharacterized membrane protein YphA (DoxX/SURF4 family)